MELKNIVSAYHDVIKFGNPSAKIPDIDSLTRDGQKNDHSVC